jgi:hypothetical protein
MDAYRVAAQDVSGALHFGSNRDLWSDRRDRHQEAPVLHGNGNDKFVEDHPRKVPSRLGYFALDLDQILARIAEDGAVRGSHDLDRVRSHRWDVVHVDRFLGEGAVRPHGDNPDLVLAFPKTNFAFETRPPQVEELLAVIHMNHDTFGRSSGHVACDNLSPLRRRPGVRPLDLDGDCGKPIPLLRGSLVGFLRDRTWPRFRIWPSRH